MGAFHAGHHSLMRAAREAQRRGRRLAVRQPGAVQRGRATSPPTRAPRSNDAAEAAELGVDVLFAPAVERDLPRRASPPTVHVDGPRRGARGRRARPGPLRRRLHGRRQAASTSSAPDVAYFGQKDAQQVAVVAPDGARPRHAGADRGRSRPCASRTASRSPAATCRLSPADRERALGLSRALQRRRRRCRGGERDAERLRARRRGRARRRRRPSTSRSSTPTASPRCAPSTAALLVAVAAQVGAIRLIDNAVLEPVPVATADAGVNHVKEPSMSTRPPSDQRKRVTLTKLAEMRALGEPIVMITAYDHPSALVVEQAGVDVVLVGDSAANNVLGYADTVPVTVEELLMLTARRAPRPEDAAAGRRPAVRLLRGLRRAGDRDRAPLRQGGRLRRRQARGRRRDRPSAPARSCAPACR